MLSIISHCTRENIIFKTAALEKIGCFLDFETVDYPSIKYLPIVVASANKINSGSSYAPYTSTTSIFGASKWNMSKAVRYADAHIINRIRYPVSTLPLALYELTT